VAISITDTGHGMSESVKDRAFEPFFTTKDAGRGTGLGLSTVYGVIKQSGGHIFVGSAPGRGTTFRIYLPQVAVAVPAADSSSSSDGAEAGAAPAEKTVLLVEDETALCRMLQSVLQRSGYRVMNAASGPEALAIAGAHTGAIDILVTDVIMPGMNGVVLAQNVAGLRPDTRVLLMSGYTHDVVGKALMGSDRPFIQKPFTPVAFLAKIREVLDAAR